MIDAHSGTTVLASFLASSVECVEALTIVMAVGIVRGWRPALTGAGAALALLAILIAVLGPSLSLIPLAWLQIAIGILLLLFGMRWLRKAVLRAAGVVPLHDEAAAFSSETSALISRGMVARWDVISIATSFKAVMLEGIEVVFIVIALGVHQTQLRTSRHFLTPMYRPMYKKMCIRLAGSLNSWLAAGSMAGVASSPVGDAIISINYKRKRQLLPR